MPPNWQRPLISAHEAEIRELIDEIRAADDIDLWEEAAAKLTDVIVVYRRAMRRQIVKFTDDRHVFSSTTHSTPRLRRRFPKLSAAESRGGDVS